MNGEETLPLLALILVLITVGLGVSAAWKASEARRRQAEHERKTQLWLQSAEVQNLLRNGPPGGLAKAAFDWLKAREGTVVQFELRADHLSTNNVWQSGSWSVKPPRVVGGPTERAHLEWDVEPAEFLSRFYPSFDPGFHMETLFEPEIMVIAKGSGVTSNGNMTFAPTRDDVDEWSTWTFSIGTSWHGPSDIEWWDKSNPDEAVNVLASGNPSASKCPKRF